MAVSDLRFQTGASEVWPNGAAPPAPGVPAPLSEGIELILCDNPSSWTFEGTNTWIAFHGDGAIVMDPGPEDAEHQQAVVDRLSESGLRLAHIVLSHGHGDHAGGSSALASLAGSEGVTDLRGCADGTPVPFGTSDGEHLVAIRTPGHTSDGISLLWPRRKVAFVGDTMLARVNPYIHHPDGTVSDILATMAKLADLVDDTWIMLPGHGPVITEPSSHLRRRIESRQRRIAEVRGYVERGLGEEEIITAMYGDRGEQTRMAATATVQALLAHIEDERRSA